MFMNEFAFLVRRDRPLLPPVGNLGAARALAFVVLCLLMFSMRVQALDYFSDSFANNNSGWTMGTGWAIGSATASSGQTSLGPDPSSDNTPTGDNGIAGYVIGGNTGTALFPARYITSPVINTNVPGSVFLEFYRWLNSDYPNFMSSTIEVWNGSSWVVLFVSSSSPVTQDTAWTKVQYDVTPYKNVGFRVRFGVSITGSGVWNVSSWNIDDLRLWDGNLPEIVVEQPLGSNVADGGSRNFGEVTVGSSTSLSFTIKNTGNSNLTGLTITKDGTNNADFTVTASPTAPVSGPSGFTTFTVQFAPSGGGTRTAAIHIANNDSDENPFDINLTGIGNSTPTNIALSGTSIAENQSANTTVATISGTDPDAGQSATLTFSLASGAGSTDNISFSVVGNSLRTAASFNFEVKSNYSIRLRATDTGSPGLAYEKIFIITVTDVNESPQASPATYTRAAGTSLKINIAGLLAASTSDPDSDTLTLESLGTPTQSGSVSIASGRIFYNPAGSNNESFTYTVNDGHGNTAIGTINVMVVNPAGASVNFALNGLNQPTMQFAGIPGYRYTIQRTTNLSDWDDLQTFDAPPNGVFSFTDTNPPQPSAYYRMSYTPGP